MIKKEYNMDYYKNNDNHYWFWTLALTISGFLCGVAFGMAIVVKIAYEGLGLL